MNISNSRGPYEPVGFVREPFVRVADLGTSFVATLDTGGGWYEKGSMAFTAIETIERPRGEVWAAATDWERVPQWMMGIDAFEPLSQGTDGVGTRLRFRARGDAHHSQIVAWEPGERLVLRSRQRGMTADYVYTFRDCPEGTEVTLAAGCRGETTVWRMLAPIVGFMMKRVDGGQISALKKMIESEPFNRSLAA